MLKMRYDEVTLYATKSAEDLQRKAAEGAMAYDALIFSGGDGTFNLVLGGVGERKVDLGYLPSGTANDVARSLGIPKNVKKALKVILGGKARNAGLYAYRSNGLCDVYSGGGRVYKRDVFYAAKAKEAVRLVGLRFRML